MSVPVTAHEGPAAGAPPPAFQQRLGLFDSTMLVAGSMIGSGIFIVSADIARQVGASGWLLLVWGLTGVMTVVGALSYAELAAMIPRAGGQYVYLREAYSPLWGFLYGWTLFLVIQTGTIAAVAVAFAKFLGVLVPPLGTDPKAGAWVLCQTAGASFTVTAGQAVAVGIVVLLTLVNCLGVREGKWVQNLFTVAKTLALGVLIILGLTVAANAQAISANTSDWWGGMRDTESFHNALGKVAGWQALAALMVVGAAMVGSLFSADAWSSVTFAAGEVKNPRRNLALSMVLGTGLVCSLYFLANVGYLAALPLHGDPARAEALAAAARQEAAVNLQQAAALRSEAAFAAGIDHARDDRVGTAVLERVSPVLGLTLMTVAIMVSTFGCANGLILSGARLYYAMARDGLFFQSVGRLNRRGVPAAGLVLQGIWSSLLIFSGTYSQLLDYVIFAALLFYGLTMVGLFVLRRTRPHLDRPYRAAGYPVIPAVYVVLCAFIMLDLLVIKPWFTWPGLIIVVAGIPVYFLWRRAEYAVIHHNAPR
jgi:APA family basic amino acid/polyamine antiporter